MMERRDNSQLGVIRLLNVKLKQTMPYILRLFNRHLPQANFQMIEGFPDIVLILTSDLIMLWLEDTLCTFSLLKCI